MSTPVKFGSEFLVNTTTFSDQYEPKVTGLVNDEILQSDPVNTLTYINEPLLSCPKLHTQRFEKG